MAQIAIPLVILNNKTKIPALGFGTYMIPPKNAVTIVYEACKIGYRHFDTAVLYGNEAEVSQGILKFINEEVESTGKSFEEIRAKFYYTTKLWNSQCTSYEKATRGIEKCLVEASGLKYIDLLLIHSPLMGPEKRLETWSAMQDFDKTKLRSIGISNFGVKHIQELLSWDGLKIKPVINQIEISPWLMRESIVKFCKNNDIQVEAYAPLTHGQNLHDSTLTEIASKHNVSNAQVLIKWSLQRGLIPLPKTATAKRLKTNIDVFSFELSKQETSLLDHPDAYQPTDWECTNCE
ncbi:hypothetical protein QEN19_003308 [Hanseniaspora menglaensis]